MCMPDDLDSITQVKVEAENQFHKLAIDLFTHTTHKSCIYIYTYTDHKLKF